MSSYVAVGQTAVFAESRQRFDEAVAWLSGPQTDRLAHAELEQRLQVAGRELLRQLLQDHYDLRAVREVRLSAVVGEDAVERRHAERDHVRVLSTVFGPVGISRIGYRGQRCRQPVRGGCGVELAGRVAFTWAAPPRRDRSRPRLVRPGRGRDRTLLRGGGRQTSGGGPGGRRRGRYRRVLCRAQGCALPGR
jgi:hypothetical protein